MRCERKVPETPLRDGGPPQAQQSLRCGQRLFRTSHRGVRNRTMRQYSVM